MDSLLLGLIACARAVVVNFLTKLFNKSCIISHSVCVTGVGSSPVWAACLIPSCHVLMTYLLEKYIVGGCFMSVDLVLRSKYTPTSSSTLCLPLPSDLNSTWLVNMSFI